EAGEGDPRGRQGDGHDQRDEGRRIPVLRRLPPKDRAGQAGREIVKESSAAIMGNALFIVWRESAEAMLVVGILYAWLKHRPDAATGMRYLWGGVAAGAALALALALVMLGIASSLSGDGLEYFQLGMMLVASGLIVQMVFWMRKHGRTLKKELEANMARN